MNNKEAAIACIQGKKVTYGNFVYELKQQSAVWRQTCKNTSLVAHVEPLYDTCWAGEGWEIYNEPLKIEPGKTYEDISGRKFRTIGQLSNGISKGCWMVILLNAHDTRYTVRDETALIKEIEE